MYGGPLICRGYQLLDDPPAHRARAAKRRWLNCSPPLGGSASLASQRRIQKSILCIFYNLLIIYIPDTQRSTLADHPNTNRDIFNEQLKQRPPHTTRNSNKTDIHKCQNKGNTPRGITQGARLEAFQGARQAATVTHPWFTKPCDPTIPTPQQHQIPLWDTKPHNFRPK